jgi:predicted AAA+ superfamily ATPase
MSDYIRRHVDTLIDDLMAAFPALMITGPRGCGKTTTALQRAATVTSLDDPLAAQAFAAQPAAFMAAARRPLLIDEWQIVPASLSAVKRAVDTDHSPGQYLITGSVRSRYLAGSWPGTGRLIPVRIWGLTQAELEGHPEDSLDWLWHPEALRPTLWENTPTVLDYVELAVRGGFPDALFRGELDRATWYDGYVDQLIHHDVAALAAVRTPLGLGRLLEVVAVNTAGLPNLTSLAQAAHISNQTATSYLDALEDMRVVQRVQPWFRNRLNRLSKSPKYYLTDTGLAAHLMGADKQRILTNGDLLGRIIDTYVLTQIRPLLDTTRPRLDAYHFRDNDGRHEVDLVIESQSSIIGIEIKASASVTAHDARHLAWLRDQCRDEFSAGYVFHTGPGVIPLGDKLWAVPIASLWNASVATGRGNNLP